MGAQNMRRRRAWGRTAWHTDWPVRPRVEVPFAQAVQVLTATGLVWDGAWLEYVLTGQGVHSLLPSLLLK